MSRNPTNRMAELGNTVTLFAHLGTALRPPPKLTISEWAEKERIVSSEESSAPGPWFSDRVPYTVGIMDAISDPKVQRVVVVSATQLGKTSAGLLNPIGYYIACDPCPIMVVQPTVAEISTEEAGRPYGLNRIPDSRLTDFMKTDGLFLQMRPTASLSKQTVSWKRGSCKTFPRLPRHRP